jgi:hypothetical protein
LNVIGILAGIAAVTPLLVITVSAQRPVRVPAPFPDTVGRFCADFPVLIHAIVNREYFTFFNDGRGLLTGSFVAEVTNLTTNRTITVNAPGPFTITADGSTFVGRGPGLLFGEAGFFGSGAPPRLNAVSGQIIFNASDFAILSIQGTVEDLCPELATP